MASRKDGERLLETISKGWNSISMMFGSIRRPSDTLNTVHTYVTNLAEELFFSCYFCSYRRKADHCQIWVADMLSVYRRLLGLFF